MDLAYVEHFKEQGYAVVRGVFGPDDVAELAAAFDRVHAEGMTHHASYRHGNVLFRVGQDPRLGRVLRMVQWPSYFDPVLERYRRDPRMLEVLAPLIGDDLKQIINQLHWKPPGAAVTEFSYHQDIHFRRPASAYREPARSYVQTVIAVDRHRVENGAITVYPGSHKLGKLTFPERGRVMETALSDRDLQALGLDPGGVAHLELEPGDLAFWGLYMIHGSGPNVSSMDRRTYVNGYVVAANCDRGEWAFRNGQGVALGEPVLVHYEDLHDRPGPFYLEEG